MNKIKDFLMLFSTILILCSVGFGLGVLFAEVIIWFINLFPKNYTHLVIIGTFIVVVSVLASLIILKENE